ncbi:ATP-dependent dethiobiotin synthetase BioD [Paracoccus hibiscisoli]|uniref:ATP-dependent dethiobiotin synthetase BioD n=1 Tax=Paracoccus hibiscisoli TaxID=2023261 RepID=A0A4U0QZV1_9RHOB|nr:ATP-dependent dethiobiotin synthetase BioD [Paracoccus hibiscisoli]TJZ87716.1 dethiobiotin synthase [Paracoccus hibiscisoli]
MARFVITSTGTDVGKTVFAAGLCGLIGADYWKPVQSGLAGNVANEALTTDAPGGHSPCTGRTPTTHGTVAQPGTDRAEVERLSVARTHPEAVLLRDPLSPHRAAELQGVTLDPASWAIPEARDLVIEGAGGALVPVTRQVLFADVFARWQVPVIVVCATGLGTISHSLTALESLRARGVPVHGVAFVGPANDDNMATIGQIGGVRVLGRLPMLERLDRDSLAAAMQAAFRVEDFT